MNDNFERILIRDLSVEAIIGIHQHERLTPQPVILNATFFIHPGSDLVDYEVLAAKMQTVTQEGRFFTLEELAQGVLKYCFDCCERIFAIELMLEKPHAIQNARSAGYMVYHRRSETFYE